MLLFWFPSQKRRKSLARKMISLVFGTYGKNYLYVHSLTQPVGPPSGSVMSLRSMRERERVQGRTDG